MKENTVYILSMLLLVVCLSINAQEVVPVVSSIHQNKQSAISQIDTIAPLEIKESDLDKIMDIRAQFEKENATYSKPAAPAKSLLRFIQKDKLEMSKEAKQLIRNVSNTDVFNDYISFDDTIIVNPLFLPLVFRGNVLPKNIELYNQDILQSKNPYDNLVSSDTLFKEELHRIELERSAYAHVRRYSPNYFKYSEQDMPSETLIPIEIKKDLHEDLPVIVEKEVKTFDDMEAPAKFIPDRMYWQSGFESVIQFSQNYVSDNWHKGGNSNLNLFTRNYLRYDYKKEKVQLTNEMELKVSAYTAPKDTLRNYKVGDDLLRIHSNFGYEAFSKWYYTFDTEFKTQLFKNHKENTYDLQAALLSPFSINMGVGMKYDLDKAFPDKHKSLKLSVNIAPLSYTYKYSVNKDIDLGRHGFEKKPNSDLYEHSLSQIGSTLRTDFTFTFNRNVSWQSRFYYSTNYEKAEIEFENTLTLAISRYFSTRIYMYMRFDDGVDPTKKDPDLGYFQLNELLSFGFNYKW